MDTTIEDADFVFREWDRRAQSRDVEALLELYLHAAILESPLIPRIMDQPGGVLIGHEEIRPFLQRGTARRPNELVRWYRTGRYHFDGHTLVWEYPRQTPAGNQVELAEMMDLLGPRIARHRIYWGWFGARLLNR